MHFKNRSRPLFFVMSVLVSALLTTTITACTPGSAAGADDLGFDWATYDFAGTGLSITYPAAWQTAETFYCPDWSSESDTCFLLRSLDYDMDTEPQNASDIIFSGIPPVPLTGASTEDIAFFEQNYGPVDDPRSWMTLFLDEFIGFESTADVETISIMGGRLIAARTDNSWDEAEGMPFPIHVGIVSAVHEQKAYIFMIFTAESEWSNVEPIFEYMLDSLDIE